MVKNQETRLLSDPYQDFERKIIGSCNQAQSNHFSNSGNTKLREPSVCWYGTDYGPHQRVVPPSESHSTFFYCFFQYGDPALAYKTTKKNELRKKYKKVRSKYSKFLEF